MEESLVRPRSLTREAAELRSGEPPLPEYVDRLCARIGHVDPLIHAFVPEPGRHDRLHAEARALAARYSGQRGWEPADRPPLYGVAVGIKDIIHVDGLPTHAGSALPPGVLAGPQAVVVDRLRAAGALVAGKTVTAEFAASAPGPTRNPHHPGHTPGGSSSGSAAAVAAGLVPLAVGTQTVGSVIRPAAYCGVVGFRPTYGRIPMAGVIPNAPSLDTLGVFTADAAGAVLAASLLCDDWDGRWVESAARPVRRAEFRNILLGVPTRTYLERAGAGPEAIDVFEEQVARLAAAGLTMDRLFPLSDDVEEITRPLQTINRFELARSHADWFARFGGLYRPETVAGIRHGQSIAGEDRTAALRIREHHRTQITEMMRECGVYAWLVPSATGGAPQGLHSTGDSAMSAPWSYLGYPAISLPAGRTADGLPLGLQVVGEPGGDESLLGLATVLERVLAQP
ncbi:amidase [Kitasatospora aureofaciens]|uniref:amidase n=1 Tax=Kitasatospora aureofaciens TaxID=1894 RepID=UPI001C475828|nr:amidase [Kitasatospora aureofaciens]MBV6700624.1 amidase [Kitasatospora aureofaciens]